MADPTMTGTMQLPPDSTEDPRGFGGTPDPEPMEDADGNIPATEAEQLDYDLLTVRARKMMFGKGKNKILKMLGTSEAPAQAIGKVGSMLVKSLMTSAKESGREISGDVAINAGGEIANDLNDLGKANGVFVYDDEESEKSELADALLWGVKYYGDGMLAAGERLRKASPRSRAVSPGKHRSRKAWPRLLETPRRPVLVKVLTWPLIFRTIQGPRWDKTPPALSVVE